MLWGPPLTSTGCVNVNLHTIFGGYLAVFSFREVLVSGLRGAFEVVVVAD